MIRILLLATIAVLFVMSLSALARDLGPNRLRALFWGLVSLGLVGAGVAMISNGG